jgi:hypothetical protein
VCSRVPHLRDSIIVAKVGMHRVSHLRDSIIVAKVGALPVVCLSFCAQRSIPAFRLCRCLFYVVILA